MKRFCFALLTTVVFAIPFTSAAQNIDIDILKPINAHETWFKDKYLELCVSSVSVLSVGAPVAIFVDGLIKHDKQLQRDGLYIAAAYLASAITTQVAKRIFNRDRPFETYSFIVKRDDESGGYSFPSGHTNAAFSTATSLALRYRKWYVVAPSYLWAASVGWGRMYQGVHYPSDVLAGAIIGSASAWISYKFEQRMNKKKPVHAKQTF